MAPVTGGGVCYYQKEEQQAAGQRISQEIKENAGSKTQLLWQSPNVIFSTGKLESCHPSASRQ